MCTVGLFLSLTDDYKFKLFQTDNRFQRFSLKYPPLAKSVLQRTCDFNNHSGMRLFAASELQSLL